jgi:hypothetical protein
VVDVQRREEGPSTVLEKLIAELAPRTLWQATQSVWYANQWVEQNTLHTSPEVQAARHQAGRSQCGRTPVFGEEQM